MYTVPPSVATDPNLPYDSMVSHIIGICSAMMTLVTIVVGARFWIRWRFVKVRLGPDDWCILVAWVLAVAFDIDHIIPTKSGLGQSIYNLPHNNNFSAILELYTSEIIFYLCVAVTKKAILNLYLRIAVQRTLRWLIWACIAIVSATAIASVTASIFQCTPIRKAWDSKVNGSCFDVNALFFANTGLDIFQDTLIYILHMRMLYQLQVSRRQKIAVILVFAVGGFVVITGMVRCKYLKVAQDTADPTYNNYGAAVWSVIECNVGVVCASLPTFKPLIDHCFPSLIPGHSGGLSKVSTPEASSNVRPGYVRKVSQSPIELEHGAGWKDSYTTDYGGINSQSYSVTVNSKHLTANDSQERLTGAEAHGGTSGIWRSTSVTVHRAMMEDHDGPAYYVITKLA